MATLPAFLKRTGMPAAPDAPAVSNVATIPGRPDKRWNHLRSVPQDDVFFYCKKIDNSRLVREADPKAATSCWSAIGAACVALALLTGVLAPQLMTTLAGYKLEALHAEERRLVDERHHLEFKEADLSNMNRLERLAKDQNLSAPAPGQVVRLNGKDSSVAMNERQ